jgi:hypothetical protein
MKIDNSTKTDNTMVIVCFCIKCERKLERKCVDNNSLYVNNSSSCLSEERHSTSPSQYRPRFTTLLYIFIFIKIRKSTKMSKIFVINVRRKSVFDIYFRS